MAKISSDLFVECLEDIQAGRRTIEDCLASHPAEAADLRSLLEIAAAVSHAPPVDFDPTFPQRSRQALMAAMASEPAQASERWWEAAARACIALLSRPTGRFGAAPILGLLVLMFMATMAGAVYGAQDALPDDVLYPVKTSVDELRLTLTPGDDEKAEVAIELAQRRLDESRKPCCVIGPTRRRSPPERTHTRQPERSSTSLKQRRRETTPVPLPANWAKCSLARGERSTGSRSVHPSLPGPPLAMPLRPRTGRCPGQLD